MEKNWHDRSILTLVHKAFGVRLTQWAFRKGFVCECLQDFHWSTRIKFTSHQPCLGRGYYLSRILCPCTETYSCLPLPAVMGIVKKMVKQHCKEEVKILDTTHVSSCGLDLQTTHSRKTKAQILDHVITTRYLDLSD